MQVGRRRRCKFTLPHTTPSRSSLLLEIAEQLDEAAQILRGIQVGVSAAGVAVQTPLGQLHAEVLAGLDALVDCLLYTSRCV